MYILITEDDAGTREYWGPFPSEHAASQYAECYEADSRWLIMPIKPGRRPMMYADNFCTYVKINDPHGYTFTGKCVVTKKEVSVFVPSKELYAYKQGALIQNAMPSVAASDREFLMSGISAEGWKRIFDKGVLT